MSEKDYEKYMKKCINLAKKAEGKVSPNPLVGAILVNKEGKIVSKGYHKGYGLNHAEVDCINNYEKKYIKKADFSKLTLFVNLEPCNHYGKTPPCTDFILKKKIKKVVIGTLDPDKNHSGGAEKLKNNGVEVVLNILKEDAIKLNEIFFKNVQKSLPFVAIKTATTMDGKISTKTGSSKWITSEKSRNYVQKLRNKYDAILTSSGTVIADNPSLTTRLKGLRNPKRIVIDSNLKTNPNSKVYNDDGTEIYIVYCRNKKLVNKIENYPQNIIFIDADADKNGHVNLKSAVIKLYEQGIKSILVEAGGTLCGEFFKANLVDKVYHFIAPKILGDKNGKNFVEGFDISDIKECRNFKISALKNLEPDIFIEYCPQ